MAGKCPDCGGPMKPLAWSEFCPNDCDRKVVIPPSDKVWTFGTPAPDDFKDEEITLDLGPPSSIDAASYNSSQDDDWSGLDSLLDGLMDTDLAVVMCPNCGAFNTEAFPNCLAGDWHCNPCGHVWYK